MSHDVSLLTLVSSAVLFPCVASFFCFVGAAGGYGRLQVPCCGQVALGIFQDA